MRAPPPAAMVQVRALRKVYAIGRPLSEFLRRPFDRPPGIEALRAIDFDVHAGEVFGLLGANGAGKTTLQKILVNLVLPTSGHVQIAGFDSRLDSLEVRRRVGYVPSDERSFFWRLTGRQNLRFFASLYEIRPRDAEQRIAHYIELFDVVGHADVPFAVLSSGRKKIFTVIRGLLPEPPVLLFDETTNSLDPLARQRFMDFVRRLADDEGRAVIWATHRLEEVDQFCDRLMLIDRGDCRFCGTVEEFRAATSAGAGEGEASTRHLTKVFEDLLRS